MTLLTRRRTRAGALLGTVALLGGLVAPAAAFAAEPPAVLDDLIKFETGHIDAFNVMLDENDAPLLVLNEDVTGSHVKRTPESVELFVKASAHVPAGGVPDTPVAKGSLPDQLHGGDFYMLPLSQDPNLIWPGWDTNGLTPAFAGADTDIVISDIDGPGQVFVWSQNGFSQRKSLLKGGEGFELPGTISQSYPAHTHAAWGFTQPGTYKFTAHAEVRSGEKTGTSNTATYTFVIAERTKLTPEAPVQSGNTVTIPDQPWVNYTDAAGQPLAPGEHTLSADLAVTATPAYGFDLTDDAQTEWAYRYEAPVQLRLEITGVSHHYHQDTPIVLEAVATPALNAASYEWSVKRKDQSAAVPVAGVTGPRLQLAAEQAYDEALVSVRALDAEGTELIASAPVTIDVNDHGAPPYQTLTIEGLSGHYHSGDIANLSAKIAPASVLSTYKWQIKTTTMTSWATAPGETGAAFSFAVPKSYNGMQVRAVLTFDDGAEYIVSAPVTIEIDDHHGEHPIEPVLNISGLADSYVAGQTAKLRAVQTPQTDEDHYHWFIKRQGAADYTVIPGALSADLDYVVLAEDAGAQIIAKLYNHDHEILAESDAVTLKVSKLPETGGDVKPETKPEAKTGDSLAEVAAGGIELDKSSVQQGGLVTVQVGEGTEYAGQWVAAWMFSNPVLLGNDWQQVQPNGTITVRLPADASPAAHRIAVFDNAGALVGWQPLQVTEAPGGQGGTGENLAQTGSQSIAPLVAGGTLLLMLGAAAMVVNRRRTRNAE